MSRWKDSLKRRAWQAERRISYKKKILQIKFQHKHCDFCGWSKHPEILDFHHKNKSKKEFSFAVGCLGNYSWSRVLKEIKKCKLLCPNCHRWLHYKERKWFKKQASKSSLTLPS
jgi:hypothetical protein